MQAVQILQLTDPHLFADPARQLYGINTARAFEAVLDAALGGVEPPDAVLVTGDIGDDESEAAYANFRRAIAGCGAPVFCLPGNHDDPARMARLLDDGGFQYCGRARLGGWGLVLLDTHLPRSPAGRLAAAELERLDAELRAFAGLPVLVCLHHPPVPVGSAWLDAVGLENGDECLAVLDRHPNVRAVLAGHVHQEFDARRGAVRLLATPSTCAQFVPRTQHCVMDSRPPGFRRLRLAEDGTLETQVGWLPRHVGQPVAEDAMRR